MKMIIILIFKVKRYFEIGTFHRKKRTLIKGISSDCRKKKLYRIAARKPIGAQVKTIVWNYSIEHRYY